MKIIQRLCEFFDIHETDEGRYLVSVVGRSQDEQYTKIVRLQPDVTVKYLGNYNRKVWSFKLVTEKGTGLIQFKCWLCGSEPMESITGVMKKCENGEVFSLEEVITIPPKFADVSIKVGQATANAVGMAIKENGEKVLFFNGKELEQARGSDIFYCERPSKRGWEAQIICVRENKYYVVSKEDEVIFSVDCDEYPNLDYIVTEYCFNRQVDNNFKTNIWKYNADGKVGIVYLDDNQKVKKYVLEDIYFPKFSMRYISEHYILVRDVNGEQIIYFDGKRAGKLGIKMSYNWKQKYFLNNGCSFFVGKTEVKGHARKQTGCRNISKKYCLIKIAGRVAHKKWRFLLNTETGNAVQFKVCKGKKLK